MKFVLNSYNSLLHRHEIIAKKTYSSNPGLALVKEDVAKQFKKDAGCVVVNAVRGGFGSSEFIIEAKVYDSPEKLVAVEPKLKVKKVEAGK